MEAQNILVFGGNTKSGEKILKEALNRGNKVTAIVQDVSKITDTHPNLKVIAGDIVNKNDITEKVKNHDVVISAYEAKAYPTDHYNNTRTLIRTAKSTGLRHLIVMGHPGTATSDPSIKIPANSEEWKALAEVQRQVKDSLEDEKDFRWTYFHYPEIEEPLGKSGKPVLSNKMLKKSYDSEQRVPVENFQEAVLDEAEHFTEAHLEF